MKRILLSVFIFLLCSNYSQGQSPAAVSVAQHIAQKMKDSLSLTDIERQQVYQINLLLHQQKAMKRQQYAHKIDSVAFHLQKIENTRDSLYNKVLSDSLFLLYKQKKGTLITSN